MKGLILTVIAVFLAACSGGKAPTINRIDPNTLVTVITADQVAMLDLHVTDNGADIKVLRQAYEPLVRLDHKDSNKFVPCLATAWKIADDNSSISFNLRDGVTFHDGAKLDADAAKLTFDRLLGRDAQLPLAAPPYRHAYSSVKEIAAEGMTLTMRLDRPVAHLVLRNLAMFSASIVSPKLIQSLRGKSEQEAGVAMGSGAAGTGPFKIVNFDTSTYSVRLEAFEQYWGGTPQIKNVLFRNNKDPQARFEALKSGQADIVDDLARNQWSAVTGDFRLVSFWAPNICYLGMNCKHEKTKEKAIREAIRLAIDQNELLPLYNNTARPNYSMLPQTFVEYDANYRAPGLLADMETRRTEAKKLLESAGALGREIKISHPKDDRPYLPGPSKIADKIKQQLNAVGFKAIANGVKNDEFFRQVSLGVYELILIGWMSDNGDPDNFYGPLTDGDDSGKPSFNNTSCSMDMKVHEMLRAAQLATDDATRISIYRNVERRLQEEVAGYVPLVNTQQAIALGKRIEGVVVDSLGMYYLSSAKFRK